MDSMESWTAKHIHVNWSGVFLSRSWQTRCSKVLKLPRWAAVMWACREEVRKPSRAFCQMLPWALLKHRLSLLENFQAALPWSTWPDAGATFLYSTWTHSQSRIAGPELQKVCRSEWDFWMQRSRLTPTDRRRHWRSGLLGFFFLTFCWTIILLVIITGFMISWRILNWFFF